MHKLGIGITMTLDDGSDGRRWHEIATGECVELRIKIRYLRIKACRSLQVRAIPPVMPRSTFIMTSLAA